MSLRIFARYAAERGAAKSGLVAVIAAFALLGVVVSATPSAAQSSSGEPDYAMATYGVGADIYVRALAVDKRRESLWVGTSVGALEIDLATADMKNSFTREDGLANEYIFAIGLDPRGHVWFGTNAGGTSTYLDGAWKTYFPMHGLADYWVYAFAYDKAGRAWIGTWNGANYFDPETGKMTTYREELINIWVYGIAIDSTGQVWFGTEGGVSMFDGATWKSWTHRDGLGAPNEDNLPPSPNTGLGTKSRHDLSIAVENQLSYNPDYVFAAHYDATRDGIWFGTWGAGVSLFDGKSKWTTYTSKDGLAGDVVYSIAQEPNGVLWFGTNRGLSRFDGKNWMNFRHGLPAPHVYAIAIGDDGTIWVGTKGGVTKVWPRS